MKKFISCLLTFVLILSLMAPLSVCADGTDTTTVTPDTSWYSNTGTSSAPVTCYIEDEADLLGFGSLLKTTDFQYEIIVLKNDITLTQEWNAEKSSSVAFWGTFDGQGHTITGLKKTSPTSDYGFIPNAGGCTIKNVTFTNVSITGSTGATGAVIGYRGAAQNVYFENVHVQGALSATNQLGGLIGATGNSFTLYFTDCSFKGTLTHTGTTVQGVGGLAGLVYAHINATGCYVDATIQAKGYAGGIVGSAHKNNKVGYRALTVANAYVAGSIATDAGGVGGVGGVCDTVSLTDVVVAATVQTGTDYVAAFTAQCVDVNTASSFTRCVFTGNMIVNGTNKGIFTGDGCANVNVNECLLFASSNVDLPAASFANATSCAVTAEKLYCDTTVYTGLANTDGVVNINSMELGGANGAKNLSALFDEDSRENWTITDTCPMPTKALKGLNVANLEMLAFQTNPEPVTGESYNIRFVGFINSTDYKEAGVIVNNGVKDVKIPATHVYDSINEKLGDTTKASTITKYGYAENDGHFLAIVLKDVPASVTSFTVTPYVVTNDGVIVYGVSGTATVTVETVTE